MHPYDILENLPHRFLIIGSTALRLHGFDIVAHDVDIWMDPTLSLAEWDAAIATAANGQRLKWRRGELREKDTPMLGTRIACKPVLDIMHDVEAFKPEEFDELFDSSFPTAIGNVPTIRTILRLKRRAGRHKDYLDTMKLATQILNMV